MNSLQEQLTNAMKKKENPFIWKGPKVVKDGKTVQEVVNIKEASEEQLHQFLHHCETMLNNEDDKNPGRYTLWNILEEQKLKCNTELFLRYIEGNYLPSKRTTMTRYTFLQNIQECLKLNIDTFKEANVDPENVPIKTITNPIPDEFENIPLKYVEQGCLDTLGFFQRKGLTYNFLSKIGLWLTPEERKEFAENNINSTKEIIDYIREIHSLNDFVNPKITPTGLSYNEFRAMITLANKKYSDFTTLQLLVLRNKVLFRLQKEVMNHARQWEERKKIITNELKSRGSN